MTTTKKNKIKQFFDLQIQQIKPLIPNQNQIQSTTSQSGIINPQPLNNKNTPKTIIIPLIPNNTKLVSLPSNTIFNRMNQENTSTIGLPLSLFPEKYQPPSDIDIHKAVSLGMGDLWTEIMKDTFLETINEFVDNSLNFQNEMNKFNLSFNEACAITYYTSEAGKILNENYKDRSPYRVFNKLLAERNTIALNNWKPFLHFLIEGLNKLENIQTTVYRGINKRVISEPKSQYKAGAQLVWISFTSRVADQLSNFTDANDHGTWIILSITDGKDISSFSLFPQEEEILLLPNTYLKVEGIVTDNIKKLMKIDKPNLDVIELRQIPTPSKYKTMIIEEF